MRSSSKTSLRALLAVAAVSGLAGVSALSPPHPLPRRPTPPKRDTALEQEIAAHNAAVEEKNATKRERKMARKLLAK